MGAAIGGALGVATGGVTGASTGGELGVAPSTCGWVDETTGALLTPDEGNATTVVGGIILENAGVCGAGTAASLTTAGADGTAGETPPLIFTLDLRSGGESGGLFAGDAAFAGDDEGAVAVFGRGASSLAKLAKKSATF